MARHASSGDLWTSVHACVRRFLPLLGRVYAAASPEVKYVMRSNRKALTTWMGLLIPGALMLSACSPASVPSHTAHSAHHAARTITVVGTGEATAKPDIARMNLGIEASAPSVAEALRQANSQMSAIITALKKSGIPDKDIRTSNFSINFERPYQQPVPMPMPSPPPEVRGTTGKVAPAGAPAMAMQAPPQVLGVFRVSNMVEVTVRDPDKAGSTLEAAVTAGANNVWNISFALDNTKVVEAQAREKAVADARARAEELARLNGVQLGPIASVSTLIGAGPGPMPMPMMMSARSADSGPPLEAGELTWNAQVQVVFEFAAPEKAASAQDE
jgi:uncharacterized protein